MLFRELEIGDRFRWNGTVYRKTGTAIARSSDGELVFPGIHEVTLLRDRVCQ